MFGIFYGKKFFKNRAGGVSQAVECLSSKHETLSSNPSTAKKKKKKLKYFILIKIFN
jgi:hypothetical protein